MILNPTADFGRDESPKLAYAHASNLTANDHPLERPGMDAEELCSLTAVE
jgi:hypothetical protein